MRLLPALPRGGWATALCGLVASGCLAVALTYPLSSLWSPLGISLLLVGILSEIICEKLDERMVVSGSLVAIALAFAFLGVGPAVVIAASIDIAVWLRDRYRWEMLLVNLAGLCAPALVAALLMGAAAPSSTGAFYLAFSAAVITFEGLNFLLNATLAGLVDRDSIRKRMAMARGIEGTIIVSCAFVVASAGVYREIGLSAVILVLTSMLTFTYMARLVVAARERTRQYAALSWGVLSGLIRSLDQRDSRAARHAAAVAAFSRDIAHVVGMSKADQELAHTAGLLHDIGRFGLSDRVMERGAALNDSDWDTIRRHPEMGADLLRDLGAYGPVAEIVKAHHERIDGRGYPDQLEADEIPEIAKIVSVAEVYDTLTAEDTYRTQMSSFEALNELRRVSGSQLDGGYVEALAELLAGSGVDYRHANRADFDTELELEKRITEAADPATSIAEAPAEASPPPAAVNDSA